MFRPRSMLLPVICTIGIIMGAAVIMDRVGDQLVQALLVLALVVAIGATVAGWISMAGRRRRGMSITAGAPIVVLTVGAVQAGLLVPLVVPMLLGVV